MNINSKRSLACDLELPQKLKSFLANDRQVQNPVNNPQRLMAPELAFGRHRGPVPRNAHRAAVLISLTPHEVLLPGVGQNRFEWLIPLTVRARGLHDHGGQIALPGGRLERGEDSWGAAKREYREEFFSQVDSAVIDIVDDTNGHSELEYLGQLSSIYVYASNNQVDVFVAYETSTPHYNPSPDEVEQILPVPLSFLLREEACVIGTMGRGTTTFEAPGYRFGEHFTWGATAMILAEFVAIVRQCT